MFKDGRILSFVAEEKHDGMDVGAFLRQNGVSKRLITKLKRCENGITLNGVHIRTIDIVRCGDTVSLLLSDERRLEANSGIKVPVAYEDDDVVVFDKPVNMPVHPSIKHQGDTLGNCFAAMFPTLTFRPINRLDKDTSGLCAVAKNAHAANILGGGISKIYFAVTQGNPIPQYVGDSLVKWYENSSGRYTIDAPIGRAGESIIRREIRADGQRAVTNYTIIKENGNHALVRVSLETGRTHQIRVHFSSVGHPLAGDDFYGGSLEFCKVQALHCGEMIFSAPSDGSTVKVTSSVREDMKMFFDKR